MQSDTLIETPVPLGHDQIMAKIQWIATIGVWLSTAAVGLGLIVVFYIFGWAMTIKKPIIINNSTLGRKLACLADNLFNDTLHDTRVKRLTQAHGMGPSHRHDGKARKNEPAGSGQSKCG